MNFRVIASDCTGTSTLRSDPPGTQTKKPTLLHRAQRGKVRAARPKDRFQPLSLFLLSPKPKHDLCLPVRRKIPARSQRTHISCCSREPPCCVCVPLPAKPRLVSCICFSSSSQASQQVIHSTSSTQKSETRHAKQRTFTHVFSSSVLASQSKVAIDASTTSAGSGAHRNPPQLVHAIVLDDRPVRHQLLRRRGREEDAQVFCTANRGQEADR